MLILNINGQLNHQKTPFVKLDLKSKTHQSVVYEKHTLLTETNDASE
jgi:hypothetical protein